MKTFRHKYFMTAAAVLGGCITVLLGVVLLFYAIFGGTIADPTAIIPLFFMGPVIFLAGCAVLLPQKLVWNNGVLQMCVFGFPVWSVDVYQHPICVQARDTYDFAYFRLVYQKDNRIYKRDIHYIEPSLWLYTQMVPFHDQELFLQNQTLFTLRFEEIPMTPEQVEKRIKAKEKAI